MPKPARRGGRYTKRVKSGPIRHGGGSQEYGRRGCLSALLILGGIGAAGWGALDAIRSLS